MNRSIVNAVAAVAASAALGLLERLLRTNDEESGRARRGILPRPLRSFAITGLRFTKFILPIAISQGLSHDFIAELLKRALPILYQDDAQTG